MKSWMLIPVFVLTLTAGLLAAPLEANGISTVANFDPALGEMPEGLAIDEAGNMFVGMAPTGEIKKVTPGGMVSTFANLPSPAPTGGFMLGMAFGEDGNLYVLLSSFDPATHGVWRVGSDGTPTLFALMPGSGLINDLDFDQDGNLYVTDSILGTIWRVSADGSTVEAWVDAHPLLMGDETACGTPPVLGLNIGPNGIAFDKQGKRAYVSNMDFGRIVRIGVKGNGEAKSPKVVVEDCALLEGLDGITFGEDKRLYGAVNKQNRIVAIKKHKIEVLAEGGILEFPAVVKFGPDNDDEDLFITNFALTSASPNPALLKLSLDDDKGDD